MSCIYKLCPITLYGAVQPRYSILSHDTLQHSLSSNNDLENEVLLQELYKHFDKTT